MNFLQPSLQAPHWRSFAWRFRSSNKRQKRWEATIRNVQRFSSRWFQPIWKVISQKGNLPQVNIKHIRNHHLVLFPLLQGFHKPSSTTMNVHVPFYWLWPSPMIPFDLPPMQDAIATTHHQDYVLPNLYLPRLHPWGVFHPRYTSSKFNSSPLRNMMVGKAIRPSFLQSSNDLCTFGWGEALNLEVVPGQ